MRRPEDPGHPGDRDTAEDDVHERPRDEAYCIGEPATAPRAILIAHTTRFAVRHHGRTARAMEAVHPHTPGRNQAE
ncbi:hypothetical protein [Streptomyces sp. DSM 15324]|uniref:hypothetical protein n=1 Tax=Streptomyces sp. DSM 15324 TaxID=1739111 RepID=UPI0007460C2B|nr:hypothetical protein [Streptomyces sp. DSM 15324]KUO09527.1 hypothetical protein AQJ58_24530 [Streptomyces sp. DSM 15324]